MKQAEKRIENQSSRRAERGQGIKGTVGEKILKHDVNNDERQKKREGIPAERKSGIHIPQDAGDKSKKNSDLIIKKNSDKNHPAKKQIERIPWMGQGGHKADLKKREQYGGKK